MDPQSEQVRYETPAPGVARLVMARPKVRNAQGLRLTYELNDAFDRAVADQEVRVIILAGDGPHFSSGHDLTEDGSESFKPVGTWSDFTASGAEGRFSLESEIYLGMCERWRNISKPTIAQVQGKCIGGGLMLAWVCDLIVASHDCLFRDPTLELGVMGAEFFAHPWELGIRKAKEFLFTSDWLDAETARGVGMVNKVVPRDRLEEEALQLAASISKKPSFAVRIAKLSINHAQDQLGRSLSLQHSFALHQLTHANNELLCGKPLSSMPSPISRDHDIHSQSAAEHPDFPPATPRGQR